jgi:hypothetical protein
VSGGDWLHDESGAIVDVDNEGRPLGVEVVNLRRRKPIRVASPKQPAVELIRSQRELDAIPRRALNMLMNGATLEEWHAAFESLRTHPVYWVHIAAIEAYAAGSGDAASAQRSAIWLDERVNGKAKQQTEVTGADGGPLWTLIQAAVESGDEDPI